MVQALALGYVKTLSEIRAVVRNSVNVRAYQPTGRADWDSAYERFRDVTGL